MNIVYPSPRKVGLGVRLKSLSSEKWWDATKKAWIDNPPFQLIDLQKMTDTYSQDDPNIPKGSSLAGAPACDYIYRLTLDDTPFLGQEILILLYQSETNGFVTSGILTFEQPNFSGNLSVGGRNIQFQSSPL